MGGSRARLAAVVSALTIAATTEPYTVNAAPLHPAVTVQAQFVGFYPGHLVIDGIGGAFLDDGYLHVHADRIILDLRNERYVAAGSVTVEGMQVSHGDALGVDLNTHQGVLVDTASALSSEAINGRVIGGPAVIQQGQEPLALPDVGLEHPYARASQAVAHLGADVRLRNARVIVPGGESVALPSYVYTFSTNPGYSNTNLVTNGEDLPIYFGSTQNSIQGVHLSYNTVTKIALGVDSKFVNSQSYDLVSASPIVGPVKNFNFTWQDYINDHTSQTFNSITTTDIGTENNYDLKDAIHRSFLDLSASQGLGAHAATFAWQSFDQPFGSPSAKSRPFFHLRSEYGYTHVPEQSSFDPFPPDELLPRTLWHTALEGYLGSPNWNFGPNASLTGTADLRGETDDLPHRQFSQVYTVNLFNRWTRNVSTNFSDSVAPVMDVYPSVTTIYHSRINEQTLSLTYDHGDPFGMTLSAIHEGSVTNNPSGFPVEPWGLSGTVRFRITQSLSLELTRSYFFGYQGERFGVLGVQVLP